MAARKDMVLQKLGREYHLVINSPDDLLQIAHLDETHWAATSLPTNSLNCDETFLKLVDSDQNGRIRTDELKDAVNWLVRMLADRGRLPERTDLLDLDAIDTSHADGAAVRAAAERILANLGFPGSTEISLDQVRNRQRIMASAATNGDGVIPADAVDDPDVTAFIRDVTAAVGAAADASGRPGVTGELVETFTAEAEAYLDWSQGGRIPRGKTRTDIMVWGKDTPEAFGAFAAVRDKVEGFFALCAMTRLDDRVAQSMRLRDEEVAQLAGADRDALVKRLETAPLAPPNVRAVLPLDARLNPAYRQRMDTFVDRVLKRTGTTGATRLTRQKWDQVSRQLAPYQAWVDGKRGASVEKLGAEKLRALLDGPEVDEVRRLVAQDKAVAVELADVATVEKLILYQQWLMELANNMVSFTRFYDPSQRSMIEAGTLILDGRRFMLNVRVQERAAHKKLAARSHICIMYLEVTRQGGKETFEIATAVTAGDAGDIGVGKRGVFMTLDGRQWEATITDVIANPVGLWEAFTQPFKRIGEFVGRFTERFSTSRTADLEKKLDAGLTEIGASLTTPPPTTAQAAAGSKASAIRDILLGGGVAIAALGSTFAYVAAKVSEIDWQDVVVVLLGLLVVVTVPPIIAAVVKLRRRNLSALLEACGWAVNAQMRLAVWLGWLFTETPPLPHGAKKRRFDEGWSLIQHRPRLQRRRGRWLLVIGFLAIVAAVVWWLATTPRGADHTESKPADGTSVATRPE